MATKATPSAIEKFEALFLKDMGRPLDRSGIIKPYEVISTGSIELDFKMKVGGYVEGRIHEIHGPEHVGKTTLCMLGAASAQTKHLDKMVGWVDMEQTFDPTWAQRLGVDLKRLWLFTPENAEDTADAVKRLVQSGLCSMIILDSVGGMITRMETDKEADEATVAAVARVVTRMVKIVSPAANKNNTTVIVVNQVRSNIAKYGPDTTTPGGWALKHITTIRMQARRGSEKPRTVTIDGEAIPVSYEMAIKIEKNKVAAYGTTAHVWLANQKSEAWGDVGVDVVEEAFNFGKRLGIIKGSGWYTFPDGQRVQGGDAAKEYLRDHPEVVDTIRNAQLETTKNELIEEDTTLPIEESLEDEKVDVNTGEVITTQIPQPDFNKAVRDDVTFEKPPWDK
jgi:recombination protein RecA